VPKPAKKIALDLYGDTLAPDEPGGPCGGYAEYMGIKQGTQRVPLTEEVSAPELSLVEALASIMHGSDRGQGIDWPFSGPVIWA
jgi:hypothetical protein